MGVLLLWVLMSSGQTGFPPGGTSQAGAERGGLGHNPSWISGRVETKAGEPIPVAMITIEQKSSELVQGDTYRGEVIKTKTDGFFRVRVPGLAVYEVCATVPTQAKQCNTVHVAEGDLEVTHFAF